MVDNQSKLDAAVQAYRNGIARSHRERRLTHLDAQFGDVAYEIEQVEKLTIKIRAIRKKQSRDEMTQDMYE